VSPTLGLVALAAARIWALLRVQASWQRALGLHWQWLSAGLAVALAVLLVARAPGVAPPMSTSTSGLLAALALELLLGTVLGLLAALPGHALVGATTESSAGLGLGDAQPSLSLVVIMASLAVGLGLGLHGPLLTSLLASFDALPPAAPEAWLIAAASFDAAQIVTAAIRMSALALALATPVLLTELVATAALACLARAELGARALAEVLGPGLRFTLALLALGAAWSSYPEAFARGM